jgi:hypothetical protein
MPTTNGLVAGSEEQLMSIAAATRRNNRIIFMFPSMFHVEQTCGRRERDVNNFGTDVQSLGQTALSSSKAFTRDRSYTCCSHAKMTVEQKRMLAGTRFPEVIHTLKEKKRVINSFHLLYCSTWSVLERPEEIVAFAEPEQL